MESDDYLGDKKNDLNTDGSEITLLDGSGPEERLYTTAVRSLMGKNRRDREDAYEEDMTVYAPRWESTINNNSDVLQGVYRYTSSNGDEEHRMIYIEGINAMDVENLVEFVNLRPMPADELSEDCFTGDCIQNKFRAVAIIAAESENPRDRTLKDVVIDAPGFSPVSCRGVRAPVVSTETEEEEDQNNE